MISWIEDASIFLSSVCELAGKLKFGVPIPPPPIKNVMIPSLIHFQKSNGSMRAFFVRLIAESNASKPYQPIVTDYTFIYK